MSTFEEAVDKAIEVAVNRAVTKAKLAVYPVGSLYLSLNSTNPGTLFGGTWSLVGSGKCIQGADGSHAVGTEIKAGLPTLPEIELLYRQDSTSSGVYDSTYGHNGKTGSSYSNTSGTDEYMQSCKNDGKTLAPFGAVYATSTIYGSSTTVQPPALAVNIWKRTA